MTARNVTTIIRDLNPVLKQYLKKLMEDIPLQVNQVHEGSRYEPLVNQTKAWTYIGVFYDYLIRKEIYNLLGQLAEDTRASIFEEEFNDYIFILNDDDGDNESISCELPDDIKILQKPVASYQKYKDPQNATLDIIEDIFNTSMLHRHFFGDAVKSFEPKLLNMNNIKTVLKYVGTLNRNNISINPAVGGKYFCGDADLILDDVVFDIKVSMYPLKFGTAKCNVEFYQLIFYALGAFINEGKEIRKFKIYNPLLGVEYFLEIPRLDFKEFSELVAEVAPL